MFFFLSSSYLLNINYLHWYAYSIGKILGEHLSEVSQPKCLHNDKNDNMSWQNQS